MNLFLILAAGFIGTFVLWFFSLWSRNAIVWFRGTIEPNKHYYMTKRLPSYLAFLPFIPPVGYFFFTAFLFLVGGSVALDRGANNPVSLVFLGIYAAWILFQWYIAASVPMSSIEYVRFSFLTPRDKSEAIQENYFSPKKGVSAMASNYQPHPVFLEKGWREKWMNGLGSARGTIVWALIVFPASIWFATQYTYIFG